MSKQYKLAPFVTAQWDVHSGAPVTQGRRITTAQIAGLWAHGDSIATIAYDFDITLERVEATIRYEYKRRVKRLPEFRAMRPTERTK